MTRKRFNATLISFFAVLGAYALYAGLVSPLLGLNYKLADWKNSDAAEAEYSTEAFYGLFPDGSWELGPIKKLMIGENIFILFKEHELLDGTRLRVFPCTVLFLDDNPNLSEEERYRQAIVTQAEKHAELRFISQFSLSQLTTKIDSFDSGEIVGNVLISKRKSAPDIDDDLEVRTQNIEFNKTQVKTKHIIDFRFGKSRGVGENLLVLLDSLSSKKSGRTAAPPTDVDFSIKSIELGALKFLDAFVAKENAEKEEHVSIKCTGKVDFVPDPNSSNQWIGQFRDNVDVKRFDHNGAMQQLLAKDLNLVFDSKDTDANPDSAKARKTSDLTKLSLNKILAFGSPLRINAPQQSGFSAEGRKLIYDLLLNELWLDSTTSDSPTGAMFTPVSATLLNGQYEIKAKAVHYAFGKNNEFGNFEALGSGSLVSKSLPTPKNPNPQIIIARWGESLHAFQDEQDPNQIQIAMQNGINIQCEGIGNMNADKLDIWCDKSPAADSSDVFKFSNSFTPQRAFARGNVSFKTPDGTCSVLELRIWFHNGSLNQTAKTGPFAQFAASAGPIVPTVTTASGGLLSKNSVRPVNASQPKHSFLGGKRSSDSPASQYRIIGDIMNVRFLMADSRSEIDYVLLTGEKISLSELPSAEKPVNSSQLLQIHGHEVHIKEPSTQNTRIEIKGIPAVFRGEGSELRGTHVIVSRSDNTIHSPGAGKLFFTVPKDTQLASLGNDSNNSDTPVTVDWKGDMTFNGQQIRFNKQVRAVYQVQQLECDSLSLYLKEPISIFESADTKIEPQWIEAIGNVYIENHQFEGATQKSFNRAEQLEQFRVNLQTGLFQVAGPGRLTSTFKTEKPLMLGANSLNANGESLTFSELTFHQGLKGNYKQRDCVANGSVRCVAKPVTSFDAKVDSGDIGGILENGALIKCDQLVVADNGGIELTAIGPTEIYHDMYTIKSARATYSEPKDLILILGDSDIEAELHRQEYAGGPVVQLRTQRIEFQPKANRILSSGFRSGELFFSQ